MENMAVIIHAEVLKRLGKTLDDIDVDMSNSILEECDDIVSSIDDDIFDIVERYNNKII